MNTVKLLLNGLILILISGLTHTVLAAPPNGWSHKFDATITLTGTPKREAFAWSDFSESWKVNDGTWDLELLPSDPPFRNDWLLFEFNNNLNTAVYIDSNGQFDVSNQNPSFYISDASTTFATPEPPFLLGLSVLALHRKNRSRTDTYAN